eukprot:GDKI01010634.1.p1 GENE.GDKI01010634.1~~GDKI01010634.1.p1  ORF type:complete len:675 (+),score=128.01 GDKI01010634.1:54-2027(+)
MSSEQLDKFAVRMSGLPARMKAIGIFPVLNYELNGIRKVPGVVEVDKKEGETTAVVRCSDQNAVHLLVNKIVTVPTDLGDGIAQIHPWNSLLDARSAIIVTPSVGLLVANEPSILDQSQRSLSKPTGTGNEEGSSRSSVRRSSLVALMYRLDAAYKQIVHLHRVVSPYVLGGLTCHPALWYPLPWATKSSDVSPTSNSQTDVHYRIASLVGVSMPKFEDRGDLKCGTEYVNACTPEGRDLIIKSPEFRVFDVSLEHLQKITMNNNGEFVRCPRDIKCGRNCQCADRAVLYTKKTLEFAKALKRVTTSLAHHTYLNVINLVTKGKARVGAAVDDLEKMLNEFQTWSDPKVLKECFPALKLTNQDLKSMGIPPQACEDFATSRRVLVDEQVVNNTVVGPHLNGTLNVTALLAHSIDRCVLLGSAILRVGFQIGADQGLLRQYMRFCPGVVTRVDTRKDTPWTSFTSTCQWANQPLVNIKTIHKGQRSESPSHHPLFPNHPWRHARHPDYLRESPYFNDPYLFMKALSNAIPNLQPTGVSKIQMQQVVDKLGMLLAIRNGLLKVTCMKEGEEFTAQHVLIIIEKLLRPVIRFLFKLMKHGQCSRCKQTHFDPFNFTSCEGCPLDLVEAGVHEVDCYEKVWTDMVTAVHRIANEHTAHINI